MTETRRQKALRYLSEERVTVLKAGPRGLRLEVRGSRSAPYIVRLGTDIDGRVITECTCANAEVHPVRPRCSHLEIARMLWRP